MAILRHLVKLRWVIETDKIDWLLVVFHGHSIRGRPWKLSLSRFCHCICDKASRLSTGQFPLSRYFHRMIVVKPSTIVWGENEIINSVLITDDEAHESTTIMLFLIFNLAYLEYSWLSFDGRYPLDFLLTLKKMAGETFIEPDYWLLFRSLPKEGLQARGRCQDQDTGPWSDITSWLSQ